MKNVVIGLGSNMGNRELLIKQAIKLIEERIGSVKKLSALYETEPWGFNSQNPFLNAAALISTDLNEEYILKTTQDIERKLGRTTKSNGNCYCDRPIDIDILLIDDEIIRKEYKWGDDIRQLTVPHPLMLQRDFVMLPLKDIVPDMKHPLTGKTIGEHWNNKTKAD